MTGFLELWKRKELPSLIHGATAIKRLSLLKVATTFPHYAQSSLQRESPS